MSTFANTVSVPDMLAQLDGVEPLRVWLDDDLEDRRAWDGWVHVTTVAQAVALIDTGRVVELSLDNDLGDDKFGEGKHVVDFLCEQQFVHERLLWPADGIILHTANSQARDQMTAAIHRYAGERYRVHQTMTPDGKRQFTFKAR